MEPDVPGKGHRVFAPRCKEKAATRAAPRASRSRPRALPTRARRGFRRFAPAQVLPSRTHPKMQMSATGGYLLTGVRVADEAAPAASKQPPPGAKRS